MTKTTWIAQFERCLRLRDLSISHDAARQAALAAWHAGQLLPPATVVSHYFRWQLALQA